MFSKTNYNDIFPVIKDFDTFITYIIEEEPKLSDRNQVLGKLACFELNNKLFYKKDVQKASYIQEQYIAIDLYFELAIKSKLFLIEINSKNKFSLIKTDRLDEFMTLNIYERYVFIIESFWTKYNFEDVIYSDIIRFLSLINEIGMANEGMKITKENKPNISIFLSYDSKMTQILNILGICKLDFIDNVVNKYSDSIRTIIPTNFGVKICKLFLNELLDFFNVQESYIEETIDKFSIEEYEDFNEDKSFFEHIQKAFEPGLIVNTVTKKISINRKGCYTLKVMVDKNTWRVIILSHKTKLHELHLKIQEAFDFDNDHMYAFLKGSNYRNGKEFYRANPLGESEEYDNLTIEDANIYKGQQFIYLFDFGDRWEFKIKVIDFSENEELDSKPYIINSKGKSPIQYNE